MKKIIIKQINCNNVTNGPNLHLATRAAREYPTKRRCPHEPVQWVTTAAAIYRRRRVARMCTRTYGYLVNVFTYKCII